MAPKPNATRKRTRARNKRTAAVEESLSDIASSSSSSLESSDEAEQAAPSGSVEKNGPSPATQIVEKPQRKRKRTLKDDDRNVSEPSALTVEPDTTSREAAVLAKTPQEQMDADFEAFYLRQVTSEFASDLEKLRSAPDFKDSSVPILVRALKQGTTIFDEKEKRMVLGLDDKR